MLFRSSAGFDWDFRGTSGHAASCTPLVDGPTLLLQTLEQLLVDSRIVLRQLYDVCVLLNR